MAEERSYFEIEERVSDGARMLALGGELDLASAATLRAAVGRGVATDGTRSLTLDLSGLEFIDSTGLHAILAARDACRASGHEFALVPGPAQVQRLFEITKLLDVLPFVESGDGHAVEIE